jgi:hypothetical protein
MLLDKQNIPINFLFIRLPKNKIKYLDDYSYLVLKYIVINSYFY